MYCYEIQKESIISENAEFTYKQINYQLLKLYDHIVFLKDTSESELFTNNSWQIILQKEEHYYDSILQYIEDAKGNNCFDKYNLLQIIRS